MIITCNECKTQYALPSTSIGADGRKVKCSKCHYIWIQPPLEELADTSELSEPPEKKEKIPEKSNLPTVNKVIQKAGLKLKISFGIMLLPLIITGIIANQTLLQENYPEIYNILGMDNTDGLVFRDFTLEKIEEDKKLHLEIEGFIVNKSNDFLQVPEMMITVLNKKGNVIDELLLKLKKEELAPDETVKVEPKLSKISANADKIRLDIGNKWEIMLR